MKEIIGNFVLTRLLSDASYYISDILNHYLAANTTVDIYALPNLNSSIVATVTRDNFTPLIYSYLIDKNGLLWLLTYLDDYNYNQQIPSFIPWLPGSFITPEGMKSVQQQAYEEAHKDDTAFDWIKENSGKVLFGIAAVYLLGKVISR